jgi:hypothetical protein
VFVLYVTMQDYNAVTNTYTGCKTHTAEAVVCPLIRPVIDPNRLLQAVTQAEFKQQPAFVNTADLYSKVKRADAAVQLVAGDVNSLHDSVALVATSLDSLHTDVTNVDHRTTVLESGLLGSGVAYSTGLNGGATIAVHQNGESIVSSDGTTLVTPATLELTQHDTAGCTLVMNARAT